MTDQAAQPVPASGASADFARLKGFVKDSLDKHSEWYQEAKECFAFVAGRSMKGGGQWPGTSWQDMVTSGRQPVEFNRCGPIIDSICGMEVNNRQEIKYRPRTDGDVEVDERLTSLGDWARDEGHAEDEESEMFRDATICGRGFVETRMDFDEEVTGKIVFDKLDPLACGVDPSSRKANFADRRYIWNFADVDTDEAASMFPGILSSALDASWAKTIDITDGGEGNKTDYPDETRPALNDGKPPKTVRIVNIQWWEKRPAMLVAMPGNPTPETVDMETWGQLSEEAEAKGVTAQKVYVRTYYQAFLGCNGKLPDKDGNTEVEIEGFTINATTGRWDHSKRYHYGVVRPMRDPQMLANKTLSQVLHILNTNAKGGLIIEKDVFANPRDAERDWSDPSKTIVVKPGGADKIKDRTAPSMPVALVQLQEFSISSIRDVTGVSVEMLGLADREQAASLEFQRRQSAMTILASLFDSLRRYRKMAGKTLMEQLRKLPPGVLVRVLIDPKQAEAEQTQRMMQWQQAAQQAQEVGQPIPEKPQSDEDKLKTPRGEAFDPAAFGLGDDARFDVIVDEAPSSPNQKEATWAAIQPFMAQLPPSAVPIALKASPLPESVATELGEAIAKAGQGGGEVPPQLQQVIEQGQQRIAELEQENRAMKADAAIKTGELMVKKEDSETKRIAALSNIQPQNDIEELRGQIETLAQNHQAMIRALEGTA